ncbi:MAG: hypothetical protein JOZ69_17665 [Myxococcales bacterium]|nr:hypothetical protein [Myxococcales bacterium]
MDKVEAQVLSKHGIKRTGGGSVPAAVGATNGVAADEKAKKPSPASKPAN